MNDQESALLLRICNLSRHLCVGMEQKTVADLKAINPALDSSKLSELPGFLSAHRELKSALAELAGLAAAQPPSHCLYEIIGSLEYV